MPNKLPNIQNTYPYPKKNNAKAKAKANYNLVAMMQVLGIEPRAYIQPHTPKPASRASITKKPRPGARKSKAASNRIPIGAWKGKAASNGIPIDEEFSDNQFVVRTLIHMLQNKTQKPKVYSAKPKVNSNPLSSNILKRFQGAAPVPTIKSRSSAQKNRVVLTVR